MIKPLLISIKLSRLNPNYADAYGERGTNYSRLKQYDKAIADYSQVIKINPNYAKAYYNRSYVYYQLKKYDEAISDLNKAKEIYTQQGDSDGVQKVEEAIKLTKQSFSQSNKKSSSEQKNYDKDIADLTEAIKNNPNDSKLYYKRARVYYELQQYDKAITDLNKAIEINPNDVNAYGGRAANYVELKQYDKSIADYSQVIKINPNDERAYYRRAYSYYQLIQHDKAITDLQKAADLYTQQGNTAKAQEMRNLIQKLK